MTTFEQVTETVGVLVRLTAVVVEEHVLLKVAAKL
jgi:hypothetical protein